jgi:serine/threonine protein kinase
MSESQRSTTPGAHLPASNGKGGGLPPGTVISKRYRVVRLIGTGGTGEVYEANDVALGGSVAIKTLKAGYAESALVLERFRREIQLSRKVTHPNVCRIFDIGEAEREPGHRIVFLTMELLAGETLSARINRTGKLPPDEAMLVAEQVGDGLQAAHDAGVVHRDLKPGNIMLLPATEAARERVVVTDFGLARADADQLELTASGEMIGTPVYMSPEQVQCKPVTRATDIYSYGVVLYELLTGQLPFAEKTALATALKRINEPPTPIRSWLPDVDPRWEKTIHRCLERDPAKRFVNVRDVVAALRGQEPPEGGPPPRTGFAAAIGRAIGRRRG